MMATSKKMLEQEPSEIEMLLPWHAAGTLNARDARRVHDALARDPELARQYAVIREEYAETIHLNESLGAPSVRAMQKLFAAIRLTRLVWPQMKERRWGRIINVLNIGAKAPRGGSAPTSITRAAGMALTKVLSHEGAPHNVLVNALLVGFIEADQHVQAAKKAGIELKDYVAARAKEIPLGRIGRAEEFANIACFLASDAGSYITGTAVNVDGGRSPVV